jgi:hypothetical protein
MQPLRDREKQMASAIGTPAAASNVISGKILHKESGNGIADLLVELFDLDSWADPEIKDAGTIAREGPGTPSDPMSSIARGDVSGLYRIAERIGSVITDASGKFVIEISARDFNLPGKTEQRPDLVLLVLAPDEPGLDVNKRLLHLSKDIYFNAGSKEAYIIRLSTALLKEKDIAIATPAAETREATQQRIDQYINEKERQREFNKGAADYHGGQAALETEARKTFRKDFFTAVGTNLSTTPFSGVLVADGENIKDKNAIVVNNCLIKANEALGGANARGVAVNLYLKPDDKTRLNSFFANHAPGGFVEIPDGEMQDILFRTNSTENPGTLLVQNNPIANFCGAESVDEKCAKEHAGISTETETPTVLGATPDSADSITNDDIPSYVARLVKNMPSPDRVLQPERLGKRADRATIEKAVGDFSLQKGPAEMPAFYDFNSLQIAFDHVWKQLFDEAIPNLAYTANTIGKSKFGVDGIVNGAFKNGLLTLGTFFTMTPVEVPPTIAKHFDISKEEYNELSFEFRQQLVYIANTIDECTSSTVIFGNGTFKNVGSKITDLRIIQSLTEQGERLIDSVRHDDYYTLHKTLRDLNDRLSGKYEFTVFAADKDYHSVNFGLLNTYRQEWTPLQIQAGKLVKSIPLTAKEEQKYSVKRTRNEKRATKEARKNNSSITNEQSSTSRVEADIMAKVQNKTNFGLNTEGNYDALECTKAKRPPRSESKPRANRRRAARIFAKPY